MESIKRDEIIAAARRMEEVENRIKALGPKAYDDPAIREDTGFVYEKGSNTAFFGGVMTDGTINFARRMLVDMKNHDEIVINVNSPGGSANAGITICNLFNMARQKITANIIGTAYSAASVMVQGADNRRIAPGASIGIHRSWTFALGDEGKFGKMANTLRRYDKNILDIYSSVAPSAKMGKIQELMLDDTSLSGKECVALGLADEVLTKKQMAKIYKAPAKKSAPKAEEPSDDVIAESEDEIIAKIDEDEDAIHGETDEETQAESADEVQAEGDEEGVEAADDEETAINFTPDTKLQDELDEDDQEANLVQSAQDDDEEEIADEAVNDAVSQAQTDDDEDEEEDVSDYTDLAEIVAFEPEEQEPIPQKPQS